MTTEITARDKLLLYVVGMLAFIFFFVQFMLTPALEASDEAAASLAEAQQAQIAMQETIALAGTNAAAKTESWAALQQANANYYGLLSSSDLDTLVSNLELGHDLGPVSLDISAIDTQSLTGYAAQHPGRRHCRADGHQLRRPHAGHRRHQRRTDGTGPAADPHLCPGRLF